MANKNQVEYSVKARHYSNQVEFTIFSDGDLREVLMLAKHEANAIFGFTGLGAIPTVHISKVEKPIGIKHVEED